MKLNAHYARLAVRCLEYAGVYRKSIGMAAMCEWDQVAAEYMVLAYLQRED